MYMIFYPLCFFRLDFLRPYPSPVSFCFFLAGCVFIDVFYFILCFFSILILKFYITFSSILSAFLFLLLFFLHFPFSCCSIARFSAYFTFLLAHCLRQYSRNLGSLQSRKKNLCDYIIIVHIFPIFNQLHICCTLYTETQIFYALLFRFI